MNSTPSRYSTCPKLLELSSSPTSTSPVNFPFDNILLNSLENRARSAKNIFSLNFFSSYISLNTIY